MPPKPQAGWPLQDWLKYQEQLHPQAIELGLGRVRTVAVRLGLLVAPPLTIIVGGTNGKGSTTTLLALIYREAGYTVGAYTSPHLLHYNERVAINGEAVDDAALCRAFAAIEQARAGVSLTYFEFGTLAALWLFREAGVQLQVLEVGLGGRLDSVNILDADAAIVTNIGLDHQDWLGSDRDAIGREKAGIYRSGSIAVCVDRDPPAGLLDAARTAGARLLRLDADDYALRADAGQATWHWRGQQGEWLSLPRPALAGAHQIDNAAGALAVVEALGPRVPVSHAAIAGALRALTLPGRMQRRGRFVFDVAHNAEAAQALAAYIQAHFPAQAAICIAGVLADKPIEAIAGALSTVVETFITCDLPSPRSLAAPLLAARFAPAGVPVQVGGAPASALALALQQATPDQPILVCGSFLTVAALLPLACP